jgi:hypothetical protein
LGGADMTERADPAITIPPFDIVPWQERFESLMENTCSRAKRAEHGLERAP